MIKATILRLTIVFTILTLISSCIYDDGKNGDNMIGSKTSNIPTLSQYTETRETQGRALTNTVTKTSANIIIPSLTSTKTAKVTKIPTTTKLVQPTYVYDEIVEKINQLILTNGGCDIPCLLGWNPDETSLAEFQSFYSKLSTSDVYGNNGYFSKGNFNGGNSTAFDLFVQEDFYNTLVDFTVSKNDELPITSLRAYFYFTKNKIKGDKNSAVPAYALSPIKDKLTHYSPFSFLSKLGTPSSIYIQPTNKEDALRRTDQIPPLHIIYIFEDRRIAVNYTLASKYVGANISTCVQDYNEIDIYTWNENYPITLEAIVFNVKASTSGNIKYFLPIDEATSSSVEKFSQRILDGNGKYCFTTPELKWPFLK